uniref:Putative secreted protein n=1 Tax=Ixodes ricinus TaxID=34613 RepID=A0A6B0U980_IXORI
MEYKMAPVGWYFRLLLECLLASSLFFFFTFRCLFANVVRPAAVGLGCDKTLRASRSSTFFPPAASRLSATCNVYSFVSILCI